MEIENKATMVLALQNEISWLETIIDTAMELYFRNESSYSSIMQIQPPPIPNEDSGYSRLLNSHDFGFEERLMLILALTPYIRPQSLAIFLTKDKNFDTPYAEFGGAKIEGHYGFIPTLETACFLLGGGNDLDIRLRFMGKMNKDHILYREGILKAIHSPVQLQEKLQISQEYLSTIINGKAYVPSYNSRFPARLIDTKLEWEDLILEDHLKKQLEEIGEWLTHSERILKDWKLDRTLKPGYKVLFYGAPGTGKTLAATLLGKETGKLVFRVDLSMIVSKYIGETEKNLGRLFDEAESKNWILFFDEADALFSKRTQSNSSNDRHANQEVAYLLQRIEEFDGLVILATNLQTNIDEAFLRRFQNTVNFPKPKYKERKSLWKKLVGDVFTIMEGEEVLDKIARDYELSGGEMINVVRYCAIKAASKGEKKISVTHLMTGIKREYRKSNKTFN